MPEMPRVAVGEDLPELIVFELRPGGYEQAAHVTGEEGWRNFAGFSPVR